MLSKDTRNDHEHLPCSTKFPGLTHGHGRPLDGTREGDSCISAFMKQWFSVVCIFHFRKKTQTFNPTLPHESGEWVSNYYFEKESVI